MPLPFSTRPRPLLAQAVRSNGDGNNHSEGNNDRRRDVSEFKFGVAKNKRGPSKNRVQQQIVVWRHSVYGDKKNVMTITDVAYFGPPPRRSTVKHPRNERTRHPWHTLWKKSRRRFRKQSRLPSVCRTRCSMGRINGSWRTFCRPLEVVVPFGRKDRMRPERRERPQPQAKNHQPEEQKDCFQEMQKKNIVT